MKKEVPVIETERLYLRGIEDSDAADIVRWRENPAVYQFFKDAHKITVDEHLKWFYDNYLLNKSRFDWICTELQTCNNIGVFGLIKKEQSSEINYILDDYAQHKGYAFEAISALINYAAREWGINTFVAEIHKDNYASKKFITRMGFEHKRDNGEFAIYQYEVW